MECFYYTLLPDPSRTPGPVQPKKIRPLEKKLGRKPATPQIIRKSAVKSFCYKFLGKFLPIIVKIRPQLGNLELGGFLGRWLPSPQEILLGHFWVQRPWIRPSGTSATISKPYWTAFYRNKMSSTRCECVRLFIFWQVQSAYNSVRSRCWEINYII